MLAPVRHGLAFFGRLAARFDRLNRLAQQGLIWLCGLILSLSGFLLWNGEEGALFRRVGESGPLLALGLTGLLFYYSPWVFVYLPALLLLFWLLLQRPVWGLALAAFVFPFYVPQTLKPIFAYRFSPVEIFVLLTFLAALFHRLRQLASECGAGVARRPFAGWSKTDRSVLFFLFVATLSLFFTERLDVATNEWRTVIIGPILFYAAFRLVQVERAQLRLILGSFVLSGVLVAAIGLSQYILGSNLITAEGGLSRIRAHYGSPNNVALYLGRGDTACRRLATYLEGSGQAERMVGRLALRPFGNIGPQPCSKTGSFSV